MAPRAPPERPARDGTGEPVRLLSVCRAVEKKGLDDILKALGKAIVAPIDGAHEVAPARRRGPAPP